MFDNPIHQIKEKSHHFSQTKTTESPLFCVPGTGGLSYCFYHLAIHLSERGYSVYGFDAPGVQKNTVPLETVEDYAAFYVKALKHSFKRNRYDLGGYCFGSLVIFEMARLLLESGHQVCLILIDPAIPRRSVNPAKQWFKNVLTPQLQLNEWLPNGLPGQRIQGGNGESDLPIPPIYSEIRNKAKLASLNYRPQPLNVEALLISRYDNLLNYDQWDYLTGGGLSDQAIACDHLEILKEPYVKTVAQWIDEYVSNSG